MNNLEQNIIKILAYFDIFQYPLTSQEICSFIDFPFEQSSIDKALNTLSQQRIIFRFDEFYSLQNNSALVQKRVAGNNLAAAQMKTAGKAARILSYFPFVRGLAISGSLSKNYADKNTDIDFFIVTKANRLWIARTLMHLFKKISFIVGKQGLFCMNYYVDEAKLEIQEKNIFTAMEIVTLIPMSGHESLQQFFSENKWTKFYFPMKTINNQHIQKNKKRFLTNFIEKIFDNSFGNKIDDGLMNITDKRWKKKAQQNKLNDHGVRMGMIVDKHFSKPDPKNFQEKIIQQYENKLLQELKNLLPASETTYSMIFSEAK